LLHLICKDNDFFENIFLWDFAQPTFQGVIKIINLTQGVAVGLGYKRLSAL